MLDKKTPLVEMENISISFGGLRAVEDASIDLYPGEVVGLLGDNGAGKSTTVNMISGIHRPSSGYISVDGQRQDFANRRDSATDAPHSGHFPSRGWARRSYPQTGQHPARPRKRR